MANRTHKPPLKVPSFAAALRSSPAARCVHLKTQRAYEDGLLPHVIRMLFAYPNLYDALGVDVRRMTSAQRAEVRESLRDGGHLCP